MLDCMYELERGESNCSSPKPFRHISPSKEAGQKISTNIGDRNLLRVCMNSFAGRGKLARIEIHLP